MGRHPILFSILSRTESLFPLRFQTFGCMSLDSRVLQFLQERGVKFFMLSVIFVNIYKSKHLAMHRMGMHFKTSILFHVSWSL